MESSIRSQLEPLIRQQGVFRVAEESGVPASSLSEWLSGKRNRRMGDVQLENIALAVGREFKLVKTRRLKSVSSETETG